MKQKCADNVGKVHFFYKSEYKKKKGKNKLRYKKIKKNERKAKNESKTRLLHRKNRKKTFSLSLL